MRLFRREPAVLTSSVHTCDRFASPPFFRGETLPMRQGGDLLLYGETLPGADSLTLPDSREATVIAPDLSNLPPGKRAVDQRPRRPFDKGTD